MILFVEGGREIDSSSDRIAQRRTLDWNSEKMASIAFSPHLKRHLDCPKMDVTAGTVAEALEQVFQKNFRLRGYILDDQGRLRKHVVIFVGGVGIEDRQRLSDRVRQDSEVYIMQALSGG